MSVYASNKLSNKLQRCVVWTLALLYIVDGNKLAVAIYKLQAIDT